MAGRTSGWKFLWLPHKISDMQTDPDAVNQLVELTWPDWLVVGAYFVVVFAIAVWAMRRIKDCGGYLSHQRSYP